MINALFKKFGFALAAVVSFATAANAQGIITTVAGTGTSGSSGVGGPATAAAISAPSGIVGNSSGDVFFTYNSFCRKINVATGTLTGVGLSGLLSGAAGMGIDNAGNVYIACHSRDNIIMGNTSTGTGSRVCGSNSQGSTGDGGQATACKLLVPSGAAVDNAGNIYVIDCGGNKIRVVKASTGIITTFAGTGAAGVSGDGGPATAAKLNRPMGVTVDASNNVYISDFGNNKIRKIDAATGIITTIGGTGVSGFSGDGGAARAAKIAGPMGLCTDWVGNVYFADQNNNRIRKIDYTGIITTVAGNGTGGFGGDGGPSVAAKLNRPSGVWVDPFNNMYVADCGNNRIRRVDAPLPVPKALTNSANNSSDILVSPNPSNGNFTIQTDASLTGQEFSVYNSAGAKVHSGLFAAGGNSVSFDQPAGIYIISVPTENGIVTKRVVITK
ncbi:MAG: T9SS type A sorting domain-containing protein [Taibaiella sp.]|nr:T9SS type A sorting domain-containing protein [Taibaiella sp.]